MKPKIINLTLKYYIPYVLICLITILICCSSSYSQDVDINKIDMKRDELPTGLKIIDETNKNHLTKPRDHNVKDISKDLKDFIKKELKGSEFKIDNSFIYKGETYLPLIPKETGVQQDVLNIELTLPNAKTPDLFWFSNGWAFARVINEEDGSTKLIDISEIPDHKKEAFTNLRLPKDLVVPSNLKINEKIATIFANIASLNKQTEPVENNLINRETTIDKIELLLKAQDERMNNSEKSLKSATNEEKADITIKELQEENLMSGGPQKGNLYLTSPDTGKIIHIDFSDSSKVRHIQTKGLPLEIDHNNKDKSLYISDLAHGEVYKLNTLENKFPDIVKIPFCSKLKDLKVSLSGDYLYILNNPKYYLIVYDLNSSGKTKKIKLEFDPNSLGIIKNTIAITSPNNNKITFLSLNSLEEIGSLKIEGGPSKIITDKKNNLFYITCRTSNKIVIVDPMTHTLIKEIEVGIAPTSLALHPNNNLLYIGNGKSDTITVIDTETLNVIENIKLPIDTQFPSDLIITNDGNWLIVTSESTGTISIIDTSTNLIAKKINLSATTHGGYFIE